MYTLIPLLVSLALFSCVRAQDLVLSATPSNVVNGSTKSLEVHCKAPAIDEKSNLIVLIQLDFTETEDSASSVPVASHRGSGGLKLHVPENNRTSVEGQLYGGSYLKLKVADPELSDTGKYQCRFAYLNMQEFRFTLLNKTTEVTFTEPDEPTPEPVVEVPASCSCDQVWAEVKDLRETLIAENRQLKDQLKSYDDSCRVSFTARLTGRNGKTFYSNVPMVFDSVLTNKGEAYDPETGNFTAPCSGQYFFRLSIYSHLDRDSGYVDGAIEVEGVEVARTSVFTADPMDHYEQSSNGLVVSLKEGERVRVRIQTTSEGNIYGDAFSVFSGFFLSA